MNERLNTTDPLDLTAICEAPSTIAATRSTLLTTTTLNGDVHRPTTGTHRHSTSRGVSTTTAKLQATPATVTGSRSPQVIIHCAESIYTDEHATAVGYTGGRVDVCNGIG